MDHEPYCRPQSRLPLLALVVLLWGSAGVAHLVGAHGIIRECVDWSWLASFGVLVYLDQWRRRRQRERWYAGKCLTCGYTLTGNVSGACPECGTPIVTVSSGAKDKGVAKDKGSGINP